MCLRKKTLDSSTAPANSATVSKKYIATLSRFEPELTLRRAEDLQWNSIQNKIFLYNFDSLKTGTNAFALVEFNDHNFLNIKANSLVVIIEKRESEQKEESITSLISGQTEAELLPNPKKEQEITIKTKGAWIKANKKPNETTKTSIIATFLEDGDLKITSKGGTAQLISEEEIKNVHNEETLIVVMPKGVLGSTSSADPNNTSAPPKKIVIRLENNNSKKPYFFKHTNTKIEKSSKTLIAKIFAECTIGYKVYYRNKEVSSGNGKIQFTAPVKKGANLISLMLVNESSREIKYESLDIDANE